MPAGCDFVCSNINCLQYKSGFSINSIWPMAKIDLVIANTHQIECKEQLKKWQDAGREYACIVFPNKAQIPIAAYRVDMWDDKTQCIWNFDVILNEGENVEDAIKRQVPNEKNGNPLMSFSEISEKGIKCPYCNTEMEQKRWFSSNS